MYLHNVHTRSLRFLTYLITASLLNAIVTVASAQTSYVEVACSGNITTAIQQNGNRRVQIGPGTCSANASLVSGTHLLGVPGQTILQSAQSGSPILSITGTSQTATINNITIEGITFDANGTNQPTDLSGLVSVVYGQDVRILNNVFLTSSGSITTGDAVHFENSTGRIEGNDISNFSYQIDVKVSGPLPPGGAVVAHNKFASNTGGNALYVHGPDSSTPLDYPVTVEGNFFSNTVNKSGDTGQTGNSITVWQANKVRITDNYADTPSFSCYRMSDASDILITGNHCTNAGESGAYSETPGTSFAATHNQWINNYFEHIQGSCLVLTNFSNNPPSKLHTAIGNHVKSCGLGGAAAAGIEAEGYAIVSGNTVDHAPIGILAGFGGWVKDTLVKDNLIVDTLPSDNGTTKVGIGVESTAGAGVIIEGNQFDLSVPTIAQTSFGSTTNPAPLPAGVTVRNQAVLNQYLGTPDSGSNFYCPDCQQNIGCLSGGQGAFARRIGGAWDCQ